MVIHYDLTKFLSGHVFAFVMLLSRVGSVIMLLPGIGEPYVSPRIRMMLAFMICLLLLEPMMGRLPPLPAAAGDMAYLIFYEIIIGTFFGTLLRMLTSTLEATGSIIGIETGLSNATLVNPALATQSPLPAAFLSIVGLVLIFVADLDHYLFRSIVGLYDAFPPGGALLPGDMAQTVINVANRSFSVGIELAAPFIIMGTLLYTGFGILQRLLPQVQIFMLSLPLQIWGGLVMFSLTITGIMTLWLRYVDDSIASFFQN